MEIFESYLLKITDLNKRKILEEVLKHIITKYPNLTKKIAWNQPMFLHKGTFIIGFSVSKNHFSVAPEQVVIERFSSDIINAGYEHSKMLFKIKFSQKINYSLLDKIIEFNIEDKKDYPLFWRK